jgi:hypothetical protein
MEEDSVSSGSSRRHDHDTKVELCNTYEVTFAVALVDQVAGIGSTGVGESIFGPFVIIRDISRHGVAQDVDIHIIRRQTRRLSESILQDLHKVFKSVHLVGVLRVYI